jgi:uncharacterized protein YcfL
MRTRRGLHTVVGAVIFTAVMISALAYVSYSLDLIGNFSETVIVEDSRQREKDAESFEITAVGITSQNKLNATIKNTGSIPVTLRTLWIDQQGLADDTKKFVLDNTIAPSETVSVGPDLGFTMISTAGYDMKVVTQRGNVKTFFVNSPAQAPLFIKAYTIPPVVSTEFDTVVLMSVTNNATNAATVFNLQPTSTPTVDTSSCTPSCTATYVSGPDPPSYPILRPGDTATFKWTYTIAGADANKVTFTTALSNGISGNTANAVVEVRDIVSALESGTAITALGTSANPLNSGVLMFHRETQKTPSGSYQMFSASPDGGNNGLKIDLDTTSPNFYTQNHTQAINIPAGNWVSSLRLQSEAMPTSLKNEGEDLIFHFNANEANPTNSEGSSSRNLESCPSAAPTYGAAAGPHTSGTYRFDGNDCFRSLNTVSSPDGNNIGTVPDTTALWFKSASAVGSTNQHLVSWAGGNTITLASSTSTTFPSTPYQFQFTVASNSNRMLVVTTSGEAGTPATSTCRVTAVTFNSVSLTRAVERNFDDGGTSACSSIWYLINPAATTANIVITTAGTTTDLNVGAMSLYNVAQSAPEATASNQNTGQSSITTNITTLTNNAWVIDSVHSGNAGGFSPGSGQTERYDQAGSTSQHAASTKTVTTAGSTSMQQTLSGANRLAHTLAAFAPSSTAATDYYRIYLEGSTGKLVFNFKHTSGSGTTCKTTNRYDDGNWYHVVGVRTSTNNNCAMYVNNLAGTRLETITSSVGGSSGNINTAGRWYVGSNATGNGNFFDGWIDDIIHWNSKALSDSPEALDLARTNYGTAAHRLNLYINKTDQDGVILSSLASNLNIDVPFYDPKGQDDNADSTYGVFNYTNALSSVVVSPGERIKFGIKYVPGTSTYVPLELDFKIDDQNITPKSSLLQIPTPDIPFPSYIVYDNDNRLAINVYNVGPYGSWFVYQGTRAVFDNPSGTTSYAGIICSVNSTLADPCDTGGANSAWRVMEDRDSIFIPVNNIARVYFWSIQDRPDRDLTGGTLIPPGEYDVYVFIDGYDERGDKFLRNLQLGRVTVID